MNDLSAANKEAPMVSNITANDLISVFTNLLCMVTDALILLITWLIQDENSQLDAEARMTMRFVAINYVFSLGRLL